MGYWPHVGQVPQYVAELFVYTRHAQVWHFTYTTKLPTQKCGQDFEPASTVGRRVAQIPGRV